MDGGRLLAYRSARSALAVEPLNDGERERLRDIAEALLLTRASDAGEAERLRRDAALALSLLVGQRRFDDGHADLMWAAISDCGPDAASAGRRLRLEAAFAGSL